MSLQSPLWSLCPGQNLWCTAPPHKVRRSLMRGNGTRDRLCPPPLTHTNNNQLPTNTRLPQHQQPSSSSPRHKTAFRGISRAKSTSCRNDKELKPPIATMPAFEKSLSRSHRCPAAVAPGPGHWGGGRGTGRGGRRQMIHRGGSFKRIYTLCRFHQSENTHHGTKVDGRWAGMTGQHFVWDEERVGRRL